MPVKRSPSSFLRLSPTPAANSCHRFEPEASGQERHNKSPGQRHAELGTTDDKFSARKKGKIQEQLAQKSQRSPNPGTEMAQKFSSDKPPSLTFSNSDQSASESSEREVALSDKASDRSHERRQKELVNLVTGLNIDMGLQDQSSTSAFSFVKELPYVKSGAQVNCQRSGQEADEDSERQSVSTSESEKSYCEATPRYDGNTPARFDSTPHMHRTPEDFSMHRSRLKHHSPSPNPAKGEVSHVQETQRSNATLKPTVDNINRDSLLMLNPERQREAFGIPPSTSNTQDDNEGFTSAESCTSFKNSTLELSRNAEAAYDSGFSHGAEKLFNTLGIGAQACQSQSGTKSGKVRRSSWRTSNSQAEKYDNSQQPMLSAASSSSSIYEDDVPNRPWQRREQDFERLQRISEGSVKSSWKRTLSQSAYAALLERHGQLEMQRQEIIWELCESEQAFLKNLRTALGVYVHPLLSKNRTWVSGLPNHISRLFDWLDDIYQLHTQISSALQRARSSQYPIVLHIAETLRSCVPKLEVYQPYVARLDEVVEEIEAMIKNPKNELGEFFRIQSVNEDHEGMVFSSFLWLPLTRLGRYLKYFNVSLPPIICAIG